MTTIDNSGALAMSGLASGVDTSAIVNSLMAIASQGKTQIQIKQAAAQARQNALQNVETKLNALSGAATDLRSVATWAPSQSATSADTTRVTAQITSGAGPGGYAVGVQNLATSEQHTYAYTPPATDSTIMIGAEPISVAAGATLDSVVSSVNSDANSPVFAVNVNNKLVLAAKTTGASSAFTASGSSIVEDPTKARAGVDANYTVDGQAFTSSSNTVTNGLAGVSLTLVGKTTSDVTINVSNPGLSADQITAKLKAFATAYNDVVTTIQTLTQQKKVADPQTAADASQGVLFADPGLNALLSNLRTTVGSVFAPAGAGANDPKLLSQIGLSTGAAQASGFSADSVAGKLTLDTAKLSSMIQSNPLGVQRLLGGVTGSGGGLAQSMSTVLDPQVSAGGAFDQRVTNTRSDISDLASQLTSMNTRLAARQAYLTKQFNQMELALSQSQSQGQALQAKLASMANN
jgi:flagellar hook-associated protein 2